MLHIEEYRTQCSPAWTIWSYHSWNHMPFAQMIGGRPFQMGAWNILQAIRRRTSSHRFSKNISSAPEAGARHCNGTSACRAMRVHQSVQRHAKDQ